MSGSSDEEAKSMKNSDTEEQDKKTDTEEEAQEEGEIQEEEEEDETDTEAAADTEVSDKLDVLSSGEENDDLPSKKQKYTSLNQLSNVKSGPDPRHSSRQDKNESDIKKENFLFEVFQSFGSAPQENKLHIVKKEAEEHFRALNTSKISEVEIEISDAENETYHMKLQVYPKTGTNSDAYKITWKSFAEKHKLEVDDEISFYKPRPMKGNHYAIRFEKKKKEQT
ncbi:hypothetical protein LOK49_LG15G00855 [Camellia lanceoleosa]|uniref:Uncharacterized protein n=1 Tax=Camellia lanceoleosa TaxID=1840588 RepID=A0ACC0F2A6_9ERIC|nr:hypothetical protein LOK49_LG15G00855 [Camellia lanceoleosa]